MDKTNQKITPYKVYATLLSSDSFLEGVLMLNWSLKKTKAKYPLFVLCSDTVSTHILELLKRHNLMYQVLDSHISIDETYINTDGGHKHWNYTFDKLYMWSLTQFDKIVYLDSDMQVIRNIDFLFQKPHMSAVRADEWNEPGLDKLNSGLMVIEPNMKEFVGLKDMVESQVVKLKNMGDQDIIRAYYADWGKHPELTLAPGLNVLYSEITHGIIKEKNVSPVFVIHYIGQRKPWMVSPRAIWRRSRNNFLGKNLLRYACVMYLRKISLLCKK